MADQARFDLSTTTAARTRMAPDLDPRLQLLLARRQSGEVKAASADTGEDEVAVLARVTSPEAWENLSEVRTPALIGQSPQGGDFIVTGRIPIRRIEAVRQQPFVRSLKASLPLRPMLGATVQETQAHRTLLPAWHLADGGAGVVVGVIDYGCDFAHWNFRHPDGSTRLVALWEQEGATTANSPFGYGREYGQAEINWALQQPNPYTALGYSPEPMNQPSSGTHGTHVMDIAAGSGGGTGTPGMAPKADLIFVDVSHRDIPFQGPQVVGTAFGDSVRLLEALRYIFDRAGNRPCVINISLGTNGGPHDGTSLVEQGIDSLLQAAPNRAVTIAAGNAFDDGIHAAGTVVQGQSVDLRWEMLNVPQTDVELELWYPGQDRFTVELIGPDGTSLVTLAPGAQPATLTGNGQVAVLVANRLNDPNNGDNFIGVFLSSGMPAGEYVVRLHGTQVVQGDFHAWIERDNQFQSQFVPPHDNSHTVGSISCGRLPLVVGSYDAHKAALPLSFFSSAGPTRDGRQKPDVSAPGHNVLAAKSLTRTGAVIKSGTSMAAPAVAGLVALMFAEARARGLNLSIDQTRQLVLGTARGNPPPNAPQWDVRYGMGRVSAHAAVQAIMQAGSGGGSGP